MTLYDIAREIAEHTSPTEALFLIRLKARCWPGVIHFRDPSPEVESSDEQHRKRPLHSIHVLGPDDTRPLGSIVSKLKKRLNETSVPWDNDGYRLIGAKKYMAYQRVVHSQLVKFRLLVDELCKKWKGIVRARKNELITSVPSRCFPSTNALRKKFSIELEIKPLDAETTLRRLETLGVALIESSLAARTTDDYKERHTQMLQQATRTLVDSLAPVVRGLPATERDTVAYQALETAFTNIRVALGTLNLDNDGNLDELIAKLTVPAKPSDAAT